MTGEALQPLQPDRWEQRGFVEPGLFSLAPMTDGQITETYEALWNHMDYSCYNGLVVGAEREAISNHLVDAFHADLRALGDTDPARLKNLVASYIERADGPWVAAAAASIEALIDYDYPFTRDSLARIRRYDVPHSGDTMARDEANTEADKAITRLLRTKLTAEQKADFKAVLSVQALWNPEHDDAADGY